VLIENHISQELRNEILGIGQSGSLIVLGIHRKSNKKVSIKIISKKD
jgi:hypothetical protein